MQAKELVENPSAEGEGNAAPSSGTPPGAPGAQSRPKLQVVRPAFLHGGSHEHSDYDVPPVEATQSLEMHPPPPPSPPVNHLTATPPPFPSAPPPFPNAVQKLPNVPPPFPSSAQKLPSAPKNKPARDKLTWSQRFKISIGFKFVALILFTLFAAVLMVVLNATSLFKGDNLNNIYVSSDLLTSAKANEARAWLSGLTQKGSVIGKLLLSEGSLGESAEEADDDNDEDTAASKSLSRAKPGKESEAEDMMHLFERDTELLHVALHEKPDPASGKSTFETLESWSNPTLAKSDRLETAWLDDLDNVPEADLQMAISGAISLSSFVLPNDEPLLRITVPLAQETPGVFSVVATITAKQEKLLQSFLNTGAYTLTLVNASGVVLAHPEISRVKSRESLAQAPMVKKMMSSTLDREFQEFSQDGTDYLGSYAKVGFADAGVVSQIPRSIAFESGQTLVRRSLLIALIALSISFIVSYIVTRTLVSPILKLSSAAQEISRGNFGVKVNVSTRDEIHDLAESFNVMGAEIEHKIENLSQINESSKIISSMLDSEKLVDFALETLVSLLQARQGAAWLWNTNQTPGKSTHRDWPGAMSEIGSEELAALAQSTRPSLHDVGGAHALAVPIIEKEKVVGHLLLRNKLSGKPFGDEDLFTAGTLVTSVGITFQNIRLLAETADKARMEKELETAKHVQDTMFPPENIDTNGLKLRSYYKPASECGGDWWGYLELPDDRVLLAIGDATGHGVPAAMVTATAKATCSTLHAVMQALPLLALTPGMILQFLNKSIYESARGQVLMTFFIAVIDQKTGEVEFATASHDPIFRYQMPEGAEPGSKGARDNLSVLDCAPGPRLGQQAEAKYATGNTKLTPNDLIVFYTDGLPEGYNPAQEQYGDSKFARSIVKHAHQSAEDFREKVLADFWKFADGEPLHDDITFVACQWTPKSS